MNNIIKLKSISDLIDRNNYYIPFKFSLLLLNIVKPSFQEDFGIYGYHQNEIKHLKFKMVFEYLKFFLNKL